MIKEKRLLIDLFQRCGAKEREPSRPHRHRHLLLLLLLIIIIIIILILLHHHYHHHLLLLLLLTTAAPSLPTSTTRSSLSSSTRASASAASSASSRCFSGSSSSFHGRSPPAAPSSVRARAPPRPPPPRTPPPRPPPPRPLRAPPPPRPLPTPPPPRASAGYLTNLIALKLIFEPVEPTRIGPFLVQARSPLISPDLPLFLVQARCLACPRSRRHANCSAPTAPGNRHLLLGLSVPPRGSPPAPLPPCCRACSSSGRWKSRPSSRSA